MPEGKLLATLRLFRQSDVEFVLVGGLAAVLHGAPVQTYDVDLVYSRTPENLDRLLTLLPSIDEIFRIQPHRRLAPNRSHLAGSGHLNLITSYGPLDLLATIGDNLGFEDLLPHSSQMNVADGITIRVLDLSFLINLKEQLAGDQDSAVLPILRQTLKAIQQSKTPQAE